MSTLIRTMLLCSFVLAVCSAADKQVHHMVMFKWKEGTTAEQATAIAEALIGLKEKVPGVVSLTYGKQNSTEGAATAKGYHYGLSVIFENAAARDGYLPHPAHQAAVALLKPHLADVVVLDYDL
jgi:hypothetical protein